LIPSAPLQGAESSQENSQQQGLGTQYPVVQGQAVMETTHVGEESTAEESAAVGGAVEDAVTDGKATDKTQLTTQEVKKEQLKQEILAELLHEIKGEGSTQADLLEAKGQKPSYKYYVNGLVGTADYPDAYNVESDMAAGVSFGGYLNDRVQIEAAYFFSKYYINEKYWADSMDLWRKMDQHNFMVNAQYVIYTGLIRPHVGAALSYTYRQYDTPGNAWSTNNYLYEDASSTSVDMGPAFGASFHFSELFALGLDFRYMINLTNSRNSDYLSTQYYGSEDVEPIEKLSYYMFTLSGKFHF
jgi:outer membrane protein W